MSYQTSDKTRQRKDAKRTAMMQAAVRVFADKGYYAATVRDIVQDAGVAIGTFYFYFPDKETLFVYLYEETADFLLQALQQALNGRERLAHQIPAALQAYLNVALYEPAVIHLLLVGGVGAIPSLTAKRGEFREKLVRLWQRPLDEALANGQIPPKTRAARPRPSLAHTTKSSCTFSATTTPKAKPRPPCATSPSSSSAPLAFP
ncbi:MAG: TetR/AcrR family transcriptional regulator [Chloroflexi bacterium]|nr:TetR/AcrR family transcriptional regulator [Chloroflexota bacterium]